MKKVFMRFFTVFLVLTIVLTGVAFSFSAEETTFYFDKTAQYMWSNYLNVLEVIPYDNEDFADLRADGTPYKTFYDVLLTILKDTAHGGSMADAYYMNTYKMPDGTLLYDYVQDIFGAYAYVLRGGKQKAVDYWNSKLTVGITMDDNGYTYTTAATQTVYDKDAYQACLTALQSYMTTANDNYCFNTSGGEGYLVQKTKYETLCAYIDDCAATATQTLVDFSGVTSSDDTLNLLITFYNNVDVVSIKADAEVQKWAKALKEGVVAGKRSSEIFVGTTDVVTLWETLIRYTVKLSAGATIAANAVFNDATLWPLGTVIDDPNQTVYKAPQYNEVCNLLARIGKEYKYSTTVKTSEVIAACEELKTKIRALEVVNLPFTSAQKKAARAIFDNSDASGMSFLEFFQARVARVTLDSNKATDIYKNYVAILAKAESIAALDWQNGTSESYPSLEEIQSILYFDDAGSLQKGDLETEWYPFREAFGLDNTGYDTLVGNAYNEWLASGLYTEESLAQVKYDIDHYTYALLNNSRGPHNTDEMVQNDIAILKSLLVEKPIVEPELKLKIKGANISLQKSLAIYFAIDSACIEQYTDLYAEFVRNGVTTTSYEIIDAFSQDIVAFKFSDIAACEAGDDITVVIHGLHDGREYKSEPFVYSVKTYCYNMLSKSSVSDGMKRICVDLLDYCAASQTYFKYQMEALVNSDLTAEQRAFGSDSYEELSDRSENAGSESDEYKISGFNLVYEDVIKAMVAIKAPNTDGLAVKVTFGDSVYTCKDFFDLSINDEDYYVFYFTEILPNKFRQTFTITFEVNGVVVGGAGTYSVESYLARRLPKTTDVNYRTLLEATAKYGDACAAFFGK